MLKRSPPPQRVLGAAVGLAVALGSARALAQDPPSEDETKAEGETIDVDVQAKAPIPSRGASDFNLRIGELSRVPRQNASDFLKLAPGILLTNKGGDGHAEQIFLRGFDAREGQDVEITMSGVPINEAGNLHGNGYADTHFIIPEVIESLRVIEGPFDPKQGNFAVAGSATYELGLLRRGLTAKYTTGSFGSRRLVALFGPENASVRTFGAAELQDTDGFGANRSSRRASAMGQYEGKLGRGTYRLGAQAYTTHFKSAGVVRADDVARGRVDFYGTNDARQGGDSSRYSTWIDYDTKYGDTLLQQQVFLIFRDMRLRENFTGFLLDVQRPTQSPHVQRGDLLDLHVDTTTFGARGSARAKKYWFGEAQEIEVGYFARADRTKGSQMRIDASSDAPYQRETDLDARLADLGLYADLGIKPGVKWLTFRGGLRGDLFTYDVNDLCAQREVRRPSAASVDQSCLSQQNDTRGSYREPTERRGTSSIALMPRGSILFGPFTGFTASASYGKGIRSIDPIYINEGLATPFAEVNAYELGMSYAKGVGDVELMARSVFFRTNIDKDLIFNETAGRNTLANGTTRTGWVGALRATGPWFDQAANLTLVKSKFDDTGLLVPYVPDVVFRSDSSVFHELPFHPWNEKLTGALAAGVTYVGRRALPFGQRSDVIFTVDTSASLAFRSYEIALVGTNLFDRKYRLSEFNFASDFQGSAQPTLVPARNFSAGAPRGLFITFTATLGGV